MMYLENLPWDRFMYFYNWLKTTKKKEYDEREKAAKQQEAAMSSMQAKQRSNRHRKRF